MIRMGVDYELLWWKMIMIMKIWTKEKGNPCCCTGLKDERLCQELVKNKSAFTDKDLINKRTNGPD